MRRLYKAASTRAAAHGYTVFLDERPLRTPSQRPLAVPSRSLAEAIATEWMEQGETVHPGTMLLMRLAATAIDRIAPDPSPTIDQITAFGRTDLVCYRTDSPQELAARQTAAWQPLVEWAAASLDAQLAVTTQLEPVAQSPAALAALRAAVATHKRFRAGGAASGNGCGGFGCGGAGIGR